MIIYDNLGMAVDSVETADHPRRSENMIDVKKEHVIKRCQQCRARSPRRTAGYLIAGEWIHLVDANRMLGDEVVFEDVTCEDCQTK